MSSHPKISDWLRAIGTVLCVFLLAPLVGISIAYTTGPNTRYISGKDTLLWYLFALCAVPTGVAWYKHFRRRRAERTLERIRTGRCPTCNYDRRGLDPAAPCPECGEKRS